MRVWGMGMGLVRMRRVRMVRMRRVRMVRMRRVRMVKMRRVRMVTMWAVAVRVVGVPVPASSTLQSAARRHRGRCETEEQESM